MSTPTTILVTPPANVRLRLDSTTHLLALTGAGISAESGLSTFRGDRGLWENEPVDDVATPEGFARDPDRVWRFYSARRADAAAAIPNAAHRSLAEVEARRGERCLVLTQNVDGLHTTAGSRRVLEMHGSLWRTRCFDCARAPFEDRSMPTSTPACDACGGRLRPAIVWFGERVDLDAEWHAKQFIKAAERLRERLVFLAIGTSGSVAPASGYLRYAADFGAETWLVNRSQADNGPFQHLVQGLAAEVIPTLLSEERPA